MRKSSWIVIGLCAALVACLGFAYLLSQPAPETMTRERAGQMLKAMQEAVARKNVNGIMQYIGPGQEVRLAKMRAEKLQFLLAKAFRESGKLRAECSNIAFQGAENDATLEFDLVVFNEHANMVAEDYRGHITLKLRRVEVSRLWGLMRRTEWRIVEAETDGKDPSMLGDD